LAGRNEELKFIYECAKSSFIFQNVFQTGGRANFKAEKFFKKVVRCRQVDDFLLKSGDKNLVSARKGKFKERLSEYSG
jgi:hypothetical protein